MAAVLPHLTAASMSMQDTQIDGSSAQRESTWIIAHLTGKSRRTARETLFSPHMTAATKAEVSVTVLVTLMCRQRRIQRTERKHMDKLPYLSQKSRRIARETLFSPHLECHPCKPGSNQPDQYLGSMQVDEDCKRFVSSGSCHHDQCRRMESNGREHPPG